MKIIKEIWLSVAIVILSGTVFAFFMPFFPIDETRYLTVAWEMKLHNSFLVPLLNNLPYSHKPPFLFWLINLDWFLFGINEKTLRYIPLLFSVLNLVWVYKIALMLWEDKKIAQYATLILSSIMIYLAFSALIMFDILLTFWVLLGIWGFLDVIKNNKPASWMFVSIAISGGLLTKGPVIFIHLIPVSLFCLLWVPKNREDRIKWLSGILLSILIGVAIVLLWAIPAARMGGETYTEAIFWGQTAERMASPLADHKHSLWFYMPLLPVLFFPWVLVKPVWAGFSASWKDKNSQFLAVWIVSTIVIFSLVISKAIHYLIPMLPAVSLLMAKNMAAPCNRMEAPTQWHYPVSISYILMGIIMLLIPVDMGKDMNWISSGLVNKAAIGSIIIGSMMVFTKPISMDMLIKIISVSSVVIIIFFATISRNTTSNQLDVHAMGHVLKEKQEEGYEIVTLKQNHGRYNFLGRLTQPITLIEKKRILRKYIKTHKKVLLITTEDPGKIIDENEVVYQQPYRGQAVVLWNEKAVYDRIKRRQ